MAQFK